MRKPGLNPRNEEWGGWPKRSEYGQAIKRNLAGVLVNDPLPVVARNVRDGATGFRDMFGVVVNSVPYPPPLLALSMLHHYKGQAPLDAQPLVRKPKPWDIFNGR